MKTIFITISRGSIAKNILHNTLYDRLGASGARLVILTAAWEEPDFINTFSRDNVIFKPLYEHSWSVLDRFFAGLHKALVYNAGTAMRDRYGIYKSSEGNFWKYICKKIIFKPLSKIKLLKEFVRRLDLNLLPDKRYADLFTKYEPDLLFCTNPTEDADTAVMKQARARGVKIIAMPKSWDNLPKMSLRVKPDEMIVWGDSMVRDSLLYQNMETANITKCGVPQFDIYRDSSIIWSREKFFSFIGADPDKCLLVLGSEGKVTPQDPEIAEILYKFINENKMNQPCQLFIRPYFALKGEEDKFENFLNTPNIIVDHWFKRRAAFRDSWDYSLDQMIFFTNLLYHADIMITHASTLMIDAAAFDKPIIGIGFDGYKQKQYGESSYRWYFSAHFQSVTDTNGAWIVRSKEELLTAINAYLENPKLRGAGREKLRDFFAYRIDGKAGDRIATTILENL